MQIALFDKGRVRISREFVTMMMMIAILMVTNDDEINDSHDHDHDSEPTNRVAMACSI